MMQVLEDVRSEVDTQVRRAKTAIKSTTKKALDENSELPVSTVHWYNCRGSRQGPEHQQLSLIHI